MHADKIQFYTTGKESRPAEPKHALSKIDLDLLHDPLGYIADENLVDAVNVALLLRQPLLLTGEAGTGKTQLGFSVAARTGKQKWLSQ